MLRATERDRPSSPNSKRDSKNLVGGGPHAAVLQHTRTIPIIFAVVADPVGSGFVESLPRPGGNVTGIINLEPTMAGKWLELLKEVAPRVNRVAFLFHPETTPYAEYYIKPKSLLCPSQAVE
jgi:putative tryptophan/tyrosine transport system substrate-binding protein